jgi:hypothetical protein
MDEVEVEQHGMTYSASYAVSSGVVTVYGDDSSESTQLGGLTEEQVARLLLLSLIRKGHVRPDPPAMEP